MPAWKAGKALRAEKVKGKVLQESGSWTWKASKILAGLEVVRKTKVQVPE